MKTLTIVRHAKSSWDDSRLSDRERPLNDRGCRDAPLMGARLAEAGIHPDLIISSPAVRAWVTAEMFARELGYPAEDLLAERRLYHASAPEILEVISEQDSSCHHLMIVGHNPGFTEFANFLSPGLTSNLPTAGVISFQFNQGDWGLREFPGAEVLIHDYPKKKNHT